MARKKPCPKSSQIKNTCDIYVESGSNNVSKQSDNISHQTGDSLDLKTVGLEEYLVPSNGVFISNNDANVIYVKEDADVKEEVDIKEENSSENYIKKRYGCNECPKTFSQKVHLLTC